MSIRNKEEASQKSTPGQGRPARPKGEMPPMRPMPAGPASIPEVVNRLEDLVKFALECEGKKLKEGVSFVEVFKQLEEVRRAIDLLNKDQQELLSLFASVTGGKIDVNKVPFTDDEKKILEKLNHLQGVCEAAKERMYTTVKGHPESEAAVKEKLEESTSSEKKKILRRKEKFRPLGGKGGWLRT
jgi:hypothetical protein